MDGLEKISRDDLRSIVSKLKIMKYRDIQKLRKNELIDIIKFKEIFPFEESFFDDATESFSHEANKERKIIKKSKPKIRQKNKTDECSICLNDTIEDRPNTSIYRPVDGKLTLKCNHYFHAECIFECLKYNDTCPICRDKILLTKLSHVWIIDKSIGEKTDKVALRLISN
jgi:hypothetical protein